MLTSCSPYQIVGREPLDLGQFYDLCGRHDFNFVSVPIAPFKSWLRLQSKKARRFGSVCTGALVLAAAGLLDICGFGSAEVRHGIRKEEFSDLSRVPTVSARTLPQCRALAPLSVRIRWEIPATVYSSLENRARFRSNQARERSRNILKLSPTFGRGALCDKSSVRSF
jgi:hypothetical protein